MAQTKITPNELSSINNIVTSANLSGNTQAITPSGSATTNTSTNNPTVTLVPGTYMLVAIGSAKVVNAAQDSSFGVKIYNNTTSADVVSDVFPSLGGSTTSYPSITTGAVVTITVNTQYTAMITQTYGSGASYSLIKTALIPVPMKVN